MTVQLYGQTIVKLVTKLYFIHRVLDTLSLLYMMLSEVGEVHERVLMHPRIQVRTATYTLLIHL